ncbi:abortive infection protein [Clostridium sp. YIM B02551]|uniref:abortive infection protein n=1 Tax=Clostridium sp. YIM B02551 TaxID=2910679 RepID=UPI001EEBF902|nr:abortive infection protein [Clostridium sp. YIM B02551]
MSEALRIKGINYDVGTYTNGKDNSSRDKFDSNIVKREMEIIKNDLHCNAVRISGYDLYRLTTAAKYAIENDLQVWFSPAIIDENEEETLEYYVKCAEEAEKLRKSQENIIFVAGCELTFFMNGLVLGETAFERIGTFMKPMKLLKSTLSKGSFNKNLNSYLSKATNIIKSKFNGKITYASGPWEDVDWDLFDMVCIDYYMDKNNKNIYRKGLKKYYKHKKPVIITEFGCCTYEGAEDKGGYGWAIVDKSKTPLEISGDYKRDESIQAKYIKESLDIFCEEDVEGAFVFTFISGNYPHKEEPLYDLDMAAYGIVKSYEDKLGNTYKDMPWDPKASFNMISEYYSMI